MDCNDAIDQLCELLSESDGLRHEAVSDAREALAREQEAENAD